MQHKIFKPKTPHEIFSSIKKEIVDNIITIDEFYKSDKYNRDQRRIIKRIKSIKYNYILENFSIGNGYVEDILKFYIQEQKLVPNILNFKDYGVLIFDKIGVIRQKSWAYADWYSFAHKFDWNSKFWLLKHRNIWEDGTL